MGLGQSTPSESDENHMDDTDDEANTLDEKSKQTNSYRRNGKNTNDQVTSTATHQEIVEQFQKLQMDNIIEERNHSERIIREKEKLLKEKEETIRQQAHLIKTQSELLGRRKDSRNTPNVSSVKSNYDAGCKPRTKPNQFMKSVTSLENVHSNGQDRRSRAITDKDFEKKHSFDRRTVQRQGQSTQIYKSTNLAANNFPYGIPFHRDPRSSTSTLPHRCVSSPDCNVPSPNSNGSDSKPIASMQTKRSQNNEYRRINSKNDELRGNDVNQLLVDLDKQTNYEIQMLDNVQNGDRLQKHVNSVKCPECKGARKSKTAPEGSSQKCKKCGDIDGVKTLKKRNYNSDDESRNQRMWTSDSEIISDVD